MLHRYQFPNGLKLYAENVSGYNRRCPIKKYLEYKNN